MNVLDILSAPWAIVPAKLDQIQEAYYARVNGLENDWLAKGGPAQPGNREPYSVQDGVAVIPVNGVIAQRANLFMQISGGTSSQLLARDIDQAIADPMVDAIVLAIDSPGGAVAGTPEVAAKIFAARGKKPIAAWTDGVMASAAYWIGSAADDVYVSSNVTQVGSIGVVAAHKDYSKAEEQSGVKTTEIYAGKYKRIASAYEPLSAEGRQSIQDQVDYLYSVFVGAVAQHRAAGLEDVLTRMADGRIFIGKQAMDAGLVDGMASLTEVIDKVRQRAAATRVQQDKERFMQLTAEQVRAEHPEIAAALVAEGAVAERARIKAINDAALPGHEALVAQMIEDGTSAEAAAGRILAAEKALRVQAGTDRLRDAPQPLPHPGAPAQDTAGAVDSNLPVEERCKARWDADAGLRKEFGAFETYLAFAKADERGDARILQLKRG